MEAANPPRYSTLSLNTLPLYPAPDDFDISSLDRPHPGERESRQAFDFCIAKNTNSAGDSYPWATLRLFSRVPAALQRPRYTGGENIKGSVMLNLKRPRTVTSIAVLLRGRMVTSSLSEGSHTFLEVVHPIWSKASVAGPTSSATGKLQGFFEWPFSFPFPAEIRSIPSSASKWNSTIPQGTGETGTYLTPQTVLERGVNANVTYEVVLKITTAGLLDTKHRAIANVLYIPLIRPPSLGPLRAGAYVSEAPLLGPEQDPAGWQEIERIELRVSESRNGGFDPISIDIECTAYIANPSTYTRGTVIPCYLICKNTHVARASGHSRLRNTLLAAFTKQQCVSLGLTQRVQYHQDSRQALSAKFGSDFKAGGSRDERARSMNACEEAVWWTPRDVGGGTFNLEGEIHLDVGHLPSCETPFLNVSYAVTVSIKASPDLDVSLVPQSSRIMARGRRGSAASVLPSSSTTEPLVEFPVRIATAHAKQGPVPRPFTPPPPRKLKDGSRVQEVQYLRMTRMWR
ncbi:hypothetical protein DFP72DRAFT_904188 [Ephemerocybe angulata]|uniref:Arrestin-like N-terminal domain-containing protein n=1 Tax=Ephemerocybe angulata TaxID=980116 RepID=A0A8H6HUK8_9AGAR|nr:hypothetical protein DFP72DRAFT_904188 [Tulosesus angulatus]